MKGITDRAGQELTNQLQVQDVLGSKIMRLSIEDNQGAMHLDEERTGDQVFSHGEHKVFAMDSQTAELTSDVSLDFDEQQAGFCFAR